MPDAMEPEDQRTGLFHAWPPGGVCHRDCRAVVDAIDHDGRSRVDVVRACVGVQGHAADNDARRDAVPGEPVREFELSACFGRLSVVTDLVVELRTSPVRLAGLEEHRSDVDLVVAEVFAQPLAERATLSKVLGHATERSGSGTRLPHIGCTEPWGKDAVDEASPQSYSCNSLKDAVYTFSLRSGSPRLLVE